MANVRKHPTLLLLALLLALTMFLVGPSAVMAQADAPEQPAQEEPQPVPQRTQEEIDQRRAEIEARLAERRPGPTFESDEFPWEPLTIGIGAGVLVIGLALVWRLSRSTSVSVQPASVSSAPREVWSGWRPRDGDPSQD